MKKKRFALILCTLIVLAAALAAVNRDLYRFTYDTLLQRTFSPAAEEKRDYIISQAVALKPGEYVISPELTVIGNGSGLFLIDGEDRELFYADLPDGTKDPSFPITISGGARQVRLGIRYDTASEVRMTRLQITADHVLYRDSLLRHLTLSALVCCAAVWFVLRIGFPHILWKLFPPFARKENELALCFMILLTAAACYPLFDGKTYVRGEDMFFHLTRIKGLAESLRAGYFPVRDQLYWLNNYGYGVGFYYPDVFLYFPAAMVLLGFELLTAYKVFLGLCTFFSIVSVWFTGVRIGKSRMAGYGAAIFMAFAAYRLSNLYYRGTVGETQAAVFFPLIILGLYEIFFGDSGKWPIFAFGFLGLLCCHIISLTMATVLTALFLLTQVRRIFSDRKVLAALAKSVLLAVGIGAFFLLPMLEQTMTNPNLKVNNLLAGEARLNRTNYAFPAVNLLSRFKKWNFAFQADCIYPGWSLLAVPILGLAVGRKRGKAVKAADFMLVFGIILVWMCTRAFPWQWKIFLPFVIRIQFAYRLLLPATVLLCLCGGIYWTAAWKERFKGISLAVLALFCFFSTAFPVLQESVHHRSVDKRLFVMQDNRVSGAEYLPLGFDSDFPGKNADTVLLPDNSKVFRVTAHDRQKLSFSFSYELPENSGEVRFSVPLIYYTGFQGTLTAEDGEVFHPAVSWDEQGLVSLSNEGIPRGSVSVRYAKTAMQHAGEWISLLTIGLFVFLHRRNLRAQRSETGS